ncbi:MAG TPA: hypothetical protein VJI33_04805, partial [Candidatus Paceibacterota bacterium]
SLIRQQFGILVHAKSALAINGLNTKMLPHFLLSQRTKVLLTRIICTIVFDYGNFSNSKIPIQYLINKIISTYATFWL